MEYLRFFFQNTGYVAMAEAATRGCSANVTVFCAYSSNSQYEYSTLKYIVRDLDRNQLPDA